MAKGAIPHPVAAAVPSVELFYFEFVGNNRGIWDRRWFLTRAEADTARGDKLDEFGKRDADDPDAEELSGQYGDVGGIETETVALTAAGLLAFANNFAIDTGAG